MHLRDIRYSPNMLPMGVNPGYQYFKDIINEAVSTTNTCHQRRISRWINDVTEAASVSVKTDQ